MIASRILISAAALVFVHSVSAQERAVLVPLFGPETFVHEPGSPGDVKLHFDLKPLVRGPYTLTVEDHGHGNSWVDLNGTRIFGPADSSLTRTVALDAVNTLDIKLDDASGSSFTIGIYGYQYEFAGDYTTIALAPSSAPGTSAIDWRSKGVVTSVKNQGQGFYDWAFSVTGAVEAAWQLKGNGLPSLSEQQLVDCSNAQDSPPLAVRYLIVKGAASEASYPYTARPGTCKGFLPTVRLTSLLRSPAGDENALQALLRNQGPVSVVLDGSWFSAYTSGVANPDCETQAPQFRAVLIVGSGTDAATGTPYWLVKNSLGTSWGEYGYFRIVRGQNKCGIADYAMIPVI